MFTSLLITHVLFQEDIQVIQKGDQSYFRGLVEMTPEADIREI